MLVLKTLLSTICVCFALKYLTLHAAEHHLEGFWWCTISVLVGEIVTPVPPFRLSRITPIFLMSPLALMFSSLLWVMLDGFFDNALRVKLLGYVHCSEYRVRQPFTKRISRLE